MTAVTPAYAHAYQSICLAGRLLLVLLPKPGSRIFPTLGPQRAKEAMIFKVGLFTLTGVLALPMLKPLLDGELSHDLLMEEYFHHVWPGYHNRSTSRVRRSQNPFQQYS